jgi:hypothetical protein
LLGLLFAEVVFGFDEVQLGCRVTCYLLISNTGNTSIAIRVSSSTNRSGTPILRHPSSMRSPRRLPHHLMIKVSLHLKLLIDKQVVVLRQVATALTHLFSERPTNLVIRILTVDLSVRHIVVVGAVL